MEIILKTYSEQTGDCKSDFWKSISNSGINQDMKDEAYDAETLTEVYDFLHDAYRQVQINEIRNESTREHMPNRYEMHRLILNSGTNSSWKKSDDKSLVRKKRMLAIIQGCYFESGIWTEADKYFEDLRNETGSLEGALKILSDLANHNLRNDHVLEGILHILSNYDYEEMEPYGVTIAIACTVNHSPVIQDLLISCFEKWQSKDSIDILESLELNQNWLKEYRDEVVDQLKSTKMGM